MRKLLAKLMRPNPRKCEDARALMSDYLDGELDPEQRKRLERHVRFCARCHTVLGNLRQTLTRLHALQPSEPAEAADDALTDRIARGWREHA
jgi:anti-sigma factor RsiW